MKFFKYLNKADFRGHVKHFQLIGKKVGLILEKQVHQPVPLQGQAVGAECIFTGLPAVGQELSEVGVTYRAFHFVANVEDGDHLEHPMAEKL